MTKLKRALCDYTEKTQYVNLSREDHAGCFRQVFVGRHRRLRHGCRDMRPENRRNYP